MKRYLLWNGLAVFLFASAVTVASESQRVEVPALPDWKAPMNLPEKVAKPGVPLKWRLFARKSSSKQTPADVSRQYAGALLPVQKGQPVRISVKSEHGIPVIMITDHPIHPLDLQTLALFGDPEKEPFPGNPVAYAIGSEGSATVSIMPPYNGVWQVWVWVITGKLKPVEAMDDESLKAMEEQGFPAELFKLMNQQPAIARAWLGNEVEK